MRYWKQENPQVVDAFVDAHPEFNAYLAADVPRPSGSVGAAAVGEEGGEKAAQPEEQSDERKDEGAVSGGPRAATKADTEDLEKLALDTV